MSVDSLTWVKSLDADFNDITSFIHMRAQAQGALNEHERIGSDMTPEIRAIEWDPVFKQDNQERREAIRLIDQRLKKLGIDIQTVIDAQNTSPLYRARTEGQK